MRTIQISTDVFAAIWKAQQDGEQTENEILSRIFKITPTKAPKTGLGGAGFRDPRYGIEFPEGFEIFRTYLGNDYRAKATAGCWMLMSTGDLYASLNELSVAIGAKTENAWTNWHYVDDNGHRQTIGNLRNPTKIKTRKRSAGYVLDLRE